MGPLQIPHLAARSRSLGLCDYGPRDFLPALACGCNSAQWGPSDSPPRCALAVARPVLTRLWPHDFPPALACGRRRFLSHTKITTCRIGWLGAIRQFGNTWEQFAFERFDRPAVRGIDDVRVDVERRLDGRVPELLLRDLHRHAEIVEQRRMNVAELMPRHAPEPRAFRRRL